MQNERKLCAYYAELSAVVFISHPVGIEGGNFCILWGLRKGGGGDGFGWGGGS